MRTIIIMDQMNGLLDELSEFVNKLDWKDNLRIGESLAINKGTKQYRYEIIDVITVFEGNVPFYKQITVKKIGK